MQDLSSILANAPLSSQDERDLHQLAIDAALSCEWEKAENLNKKIIKVDPENVASLNRLARALFELGKYQQVKRICQQVLNIDPYNTIAQKNFKKVSDFKKNNNGRLKIKEKQENQSGFLTKLFLGKRETKKDLSQTKTNGGGNLRVKTNIISPFLFLEEAGVTKIVNLIKLAEPQKLSRLYAGSMVKLLVKNRGISVTDLEGAYLGVLADDISHLLLRLIRGGNQYSVIIKSVKANALSILIRETYRARHFKNQPSFIEYAKASAYSSDHITLSLDEEVEEVTESESDEA